MFVCSFAQGHYRVRSKSGKQTIFFEDSDRFGPSKYDPRKDEVSLIPSKSWFWAFYQEWREAGRPTDGKSTGPHVTLLHAVWADDAAIRSHDWIFRFGLDCCRKCGIVKRADGKNRPCPGPVRVELRENRIKDEGNADG